MPVYRKSTKRDWVKTVAYIATYLAVLGFSSPFLLLSYWFLWITLVIGGLVLLVSWHAKTSAYRCPICGCEFEISMLADFISAHGVDSEGGWKYLRCPNCSNRSRMRILTKERTEL